MKIMEIYGQFCVFLKNELLNKETFIVNTKKLNTNTKEMLTINLHTLIPYMSQISGFCIPPSISPCFVVEIF